MTSVPASPEAAGTGGRPRAVTDTDVGARPAVREPDLRVLFVCTGNICRSPAAERLARRHLEQALGDAPSPVRWESAGTRAAVGSPVHPDTAAVVAALGGDTSGFAARRLTAPMVRDADLVLTMTREHRRLALTLDPRALSRTFTLLEAADLVRLLAERPAGGAVAPAGELRTPAQDLADARALRRSGDDDVLDPIGQAPDVHQDVVGTISAALQPVVQFLLPALEARRSS